MNNLAIASSGTARLQLKEFANVIPVKENEMVFKYREGESVHTVWNGN
jgi:hypothetical protein